MSQAIRHDRTAGGAKALAASRAGVFGDLVPVGLTTLILTVLIGLLSGAVWTQLT